MVYLTKVYEFSSAHRLHSHVLSDEENREIFGKCNNPSGHGHNYVLEVTVKGEVDLRTGLVAGLNFLDEVVQKQVYTRFDYKHLNLDTSEFENLIRLRRTSSKCYGMYWCRICVQWFYTACAYEKRQKIISTTMVSNLFFPH